MSKARRSMDHTERIAKLVVETALPGAEMVFRDEQSHGEYDFDLHYPTGMLAAVEVTESADQIQKQTSAEIRNKKNGGPLIVAKRCQKSWAIFPMKNPNITAIRKKADTYLFSLELAGRESFDCLEACNIRACRNAGIEKSLVNPAPKCVEDICYDLKIMSGSVISAGPPPRIFIKHPVYGGAVGPSTATKAGEREAFKDDNRKKLGAANTYERHLVVYADVGLPWIALTTSEPPSTLPQVPEEITHMWLIGHSGENKDEFVVWRASAKEQWHSQRVSCPPNKRNGHN
jgi:hypothetical protein